jgi:N-acetylglucosaminyldiphosphoundecaprenol N-acetyl-beta-D-mannosaminyltransferase
LAEGHESGAVLCGYGNRMRTAEDDLAPKPRMQRIGLAWFCRLTREPRRLARRHLPPGPMNSLRAVRAQLICYPGVYYAGTPISEHAEIPNAARNPTPPKPATA